MSGFPDESPFFFGLRVGIRFCDGGKFLVGTLFALSPVSFDVITKLFAVTDLLLGDLGLFDGQMARGRHSIDRTSDTEIWAVSLSFIVSAGTARLAAFDESR